MDYKGRNIVILMRWGMGTGNMKIEIRYSLLGVPFYNPLFIIRNVVKN